MKEAKRDAENRLKYETFINLVPTEQIKYFNELIGKSPVLEWERLLLIAMQKQDANLLNVCSGLLPFYNKFKDYLKENKPKEIVKKSAPVKKLKSSKK